MTKKIRTLKLGKMLLVPIKKECGHTDYACLKSLRMNENL